MTVQKGDRQYIIQDIGAFWKIDTVSGKLTVCYKLPKSDYPDESSVEKFIFENDLF